MGKVKQQEQLGLLRFFLKLFTQAIFGRGHSMQFLPRTGYEKNVAHTRRNDGEDGNEGTPCFIEHKQ